MSLHTKSTPPWYRQFWPWFIIALPAAVVVASLTTVFIAFINADSMVNDDYFKEGMAINMRLEQDKLAEKLQLSARLRWDSATGDLMLDLSTRHDNPQHQAQIDLLEQIQLQLNHPVQPQLDRQLTLTRVMPGHFKTSLSEPLTHRYYTRLLPLPDMNWRISGEMDFSEQSEAILGH